VSCQFARAITLVKEQSIEQHIEVEYSGWRKIIGLYQEAKKTIEQQWRDLATADDTGLKFVHADKLAIMDVACLLQQILSGDAKVSKEQELVAQFMEILTGKPLAPVPQNTIAVTVSTPLVFSPTATASPQSGSATTSSPTSPSSSLSLDVMMKRLQFLEEQARHKEEQANQEKAEKEAIRLKLEKQEKELKALKAAVNPDDETVPVGSDDQQQLLMSAQAKAAASSQQNSSASAVQLHSEVHEHSGRLHQVEVAVMSLQAQNDALQLQVAEANVLLKQKKK
jgi:hypothetical protein